MFCKNEFKNRFRGWAFNNLEKEKEDAYIFCKKELTEKEYLKNKWLIDEMIQWFYWLKTSNEHTIDEWDLATWTPSSQHAC